MSTSRKKASKDDVEQLLERLLDDEDLDDHYAAREELASVTGDRRDALTTAVVAAAFAKPPRTAAASVLADLGGPRAIEALVKLARDPDDELREEAVMALGNLESHPAAAVPALVLALTDANEDIRDQAADALGEYASASAVEPLLAALADARKDARWKSDVRVGGILEALAASGPTDARVLDALVEHLVPGAPAVSKPAFEAITLLGKKADRARPALEAFAASDGTDPWMAVHAHRALIALGDPADAHVPAILQGLLVKDQGGAVNAAASGLLQDLGATARPFLDAAVKGKNAALRKVAERVRTRMASRR